MAASELMESEQWQHLDVADRIAQEGISDTPGLWLESAIDIPRGSSRFELSGVHVGWDVRE